MVIAKNALSNKTNFNVSKPPSTPNLLNQPIPQSPNSWFLQHTLTIKQIISLPRINTQFKWPDQTSIGWYCQLKVQSAKLLA